jgi:hypothetical protein
MLTVLAVLFDLIPLAGFITGLIFLGGAFQSASQVGESVARCVPDSTDGVFTPGIKVENPYEDCTVGDVKKGGEFVGMVAGAAGSIALGFPLYFILGAIVPFVAFLFFSFIFLFFFHYNPVGLSPKKMIRNFLSFIGEGTPFANLLPWITISTIGHVLTCRAEDREKTLGTVKATGFKLTRFASRFVPVAGGVVAGAVGMTERRAIKNTPEQIPRRGILARTKPFERAPQQSQKTQPQEQTMNSTQPKEKKKDFGPSSDFSTLERGATSFSKDMPSNGVRRIV